MHATQAQKTTDLHKGTHSDYHTMAFLFLGQTKGNPFYVNTSELCWWWMRKIYLAGMCVVGGPLSHRINRTRLGGFLLSPPHRCKLGRLRAPLPGNERGGGRQFKIPTKRREEPTNLEEKGGKGG